MPVPDVTEHRDSDLIDKKGEFGPKGKTYPMVLQQRGIHTHVKRNGIWVLTRQVAKGTGSLTSNGRPLVPLPEKKR